MDGTIRALRVVDVRKKDVDKTAGHVVIMNEQGDKVAITGSEGITLGFNPEDQVVVTMSKANKTIKEAIATDKKKK